MDQNTSTAHGFVFQRCKFPLEVSRLCKMTAGDPNKKCRWFDPSWYISKIKLLWFSRFRCKQVSHQHSEFWVFFENWKNSSTYSIHQYLPGRVKELPSFCSAPDLQSWLLFIIFHLGHFTHFHCLAGSYSHSDLHLGLKIEVNIRLSKKVRELFNISLWRLQEAVFVKEIYIFK